MLLTDLLKVLDKIRTLTGAEFGQLVWQFSNPGRSGTAWLTTPPASWSDFIGTIYFISLSILKFEKKIVEDGARSQNGWFECNFLKEKIMFKQVNKIKPKS